MVEAELGGIDDGAKAADDAGLLQPLQSHLAGGLGQADGGGEIGDGHAAILHQRGDDAAIELVHFD